MTTVSIACAVALAIATVAAITDWKTGLIPNWLTLPCLVVGPVIHAVGSGVRGVADSALGLLFCALVPYFLFRRGALGGGDVKMFAALGALLGVTMGIEAQFFTLSFAALLALLQLTWRGRLGGVMSNVARMIINPFVPASKRRVVEPELMAQVRLGVSIALGTLFAIGYRVFPWLA